MIETPRSWNSTEDHGGSELARKCQKNQIKRLIHITKLYPLLLSAVLICASFLTPLRATTLPNVDLSSFSYAHGFTMTGGGHSVSAAGDINGDGIGDVIIGVPWANSDTGMVAVVFGKKNAVITQLDLQTFVAGPTTGFCIIAPSAGARCGYSVSKAGDVNGDGADDVILGAWGVDVGTKIDAGVSYVIFGRKVTSAAGNAFTNIQLLNTALAANVGFRILGAAAHDQSCFVSGAGDVNGDGIDDVIVGSNLADRLSLGGDNKAGIAYVVFGKDMTGNTDAFGDVDLALIVNTSPLGFRIIGAAAGDRLGFYVSCAGDVNADGVSDVIVGARYANSNAGIAYVIFGRKVTSTANAFSDYQLSTGQVVPTDGFRILGGAFGDYLGSPVSGAGDINGDGVNDLIVGAYLVDLPGLPNSDAGIAYVIFGRNIGGGAAAFDDIWPASLTSGSAVGFRLFGAAGSYSGHSVSSAGDINDDGIDDIIVGAPYADPSGSRLDAGISYVVYGRKSSGDVDLASITADSAVGFRILGAAANDRSGFSVSGAGDINGDTVADIIVGTELRSSYVIYGTPATPTSQPSSQPTRQPSGQPSRQPSRQPSNQPSRQPTIQPSRQPTSQPTIQPIQQPSGQPVTAPTGQPSMQPSHQPTSQPSTEPSGQPNNQPSSQPTVIPSAQPSRRSTSQSSARPTTQPSVRPSGQPTTQPSRNPSAQPSSQPSSGPTTQPSTQPSSDPSHQPSIQPSKQPSSLPSNQPSGQPSRQPMARPSQQPSKQPSSQPSLQPSRHPSQQPSSKPSMQPSTQPSTAPSSQPTCIPSTRPSGQPTSQPSAQPSAQPSSQPSQQQTAPPTTQLTDQPSVQPSAQPSSQPSGQPSNVPTRSPSAQPSSIPSSAPSGQPSEQPLGQPTGQPTEQPSTEPSGTPTAQPSHTPSCQPSDQPSSQPSAHPSQQPVAYPSTQPTTQPTGQPTPVSHMGAVSVEHLVVTRDIIVVNNTLWVCGSGHNVSCAVLEATTGLMRTQYSFPWTETKEVTVTDTPGRVFITGQTHSSQGTVTSDVASCTIDLMEQLSCTAKNLYDMQFTAVTFVPIAKKVVYFGTVSTHVLVCTVDASTSTQDLILLNSYAYAFPSMHSVTVTHALSPPVYVGGFFVGTATSANGLSNYIVAGVVRTDSGSMTAMYLAPASGSVLNSAELMNAMALEYEHPDSFIAGGLELSDGAGMHAYLIRVNAFFGSVKYSVQYRPSDYSIGGSRRRTMGEQAVQSSVTSGMVHIDSDMYMLVNWNRITHNNTSSAASVTMLKVDMATGLILQQTHVSSLTASISCTDITTSSHSLDLYLACNVQYNDLRSEVVVIDTDLELKFKHLPLGFHRDTDVLFTEEFVPFRRYSLPVTSKRTDIVTSDYTFTTAEASPSFRPSISPTVSPSSQPSSAPSGQPSSSPSAAPSVSPLPTSQPSSSGPTNTYKPTVKPTQRPSAAPTKVPTLSPSVSPSKIPTSRPSAAPSSAPSTLSSLASTVLPSCIPSAKPTRKPTIRPAASPTQTPTTIASTVVVVAAVANKNKADGTVMIFVYILAGVTGLWCAYQLLKCSIQVQKEREKKLLLRVELEQVRSTILSEKSQVGDIGIPAAVEPTGEAASKRPRGAYATGVPILPEEVGSDASSSILVSSLHSSEMSDVSDSMYSDNPNSQEYNSQSVHSKSVENMMEEGGDGHSYVESTGGSYGDIEHSDNSGGSDSIGSKSNSGGSVTDHSADGAIFSDSGDGI